jgi:hypothetical protein
MLEIRAEAAGVLIATDCLQSPTEESSLEASPRKSRSGLRRNFGELSRAVGMAPNAVKDFFGGRRIGRRVGQGRLGGRRPTF